MAKENVTKRKATPRSRLAHSPCAPGSRACYGVRRQSIPGLTSNWPTSCGPSFGQFLRSLAAIEGAPVARVVRARATAKRQSHPRQLLLALLYLLHPCSRHPPAGHLLPQSGRRKCQSKAVVWGSLRCLGCAGCAVEGPPMQRQCDVGKARRVGAMDCAQFDASPGMDCRRTPGVALRSRRAGCPETAASGWPSLWCLSLGHARERHSLAGRRVKKGRDAAPRRGVL